MDDKGKTENDKIKGQGGLKDSFDEQQTKPISFSDTDVKIPIHTSSGSQQNIPKSNSSKKDFHLDFGNFEKFIKNKKFLIYLALFLILFFSVYARSITLKAPSLISTDSFWQYRHAKEIYEHGYPGNAIKPLAPGESSICWREPACTLDKKNVYWDYLHDAPTGGAVSIELYQYFSAYSYKYFAKFFFPNLLEWMRVTPGLFIMLATLTIFLIGRKLFSDMTGLFASFFFAFSGNITGRSFLGYADSDALVLFLFLLTFYLFLEAWDKKSFKWAAIAGVSLGLLGFATPAAYTLVPILLSAITAVYFLYKLTTGLLKKKKIYDIIKEDWKNYSVFIIFLAIGLLIVAVVESPLHANIFRSLINFIQIKAPERSVAAGTRNILLTVVEFRTVSLRELIYFIHSSLFILLGLFLTLLPFEMKAKIWKNTYHIIFLAVLFSAFFYASMKTIRSVPFLIFPLAIVGGLTLDYFIEKISLKKLLTSSLIILFIITLLFFLPNISPPEANAATIRASYFETAFKFGGAGLEFAQADLPLPWFDFFAWAKQNTTKGSIFASWWDHGHEVTALAERPVIIDGSQNYGRVADMAKFFTTTNATEAVKILKKYNVTYVFTSSDMFEKYTSIEYVATGRNIKRTVLKLSAVESLGNNITNYIYGYGDLAKNTKLVLTVNNSSGDATANMALNYNLVKIPDIYYSIDGKVYSKQDTVDGNRSIDIPLYFTPDYMYAIPLPDGIDKSILIRLQFLNGLGLEDYFEHVKIFHGGTVNVFKLIY